MTNASPSLSSKDSGGDLRTPGSDPWWRFGFHSWQHGIDEGARNILRAAQDGTSRWIMGTFEAREIRRCKYCGREEFRDVYGGNYRPHDWTLRRYATPTPEGWKTGEVKTPDGEAQESVSIQELTPEGLRQTLKSPTR